MFYRTGNEVLHPRKKAGDGEPQFRLL